MASSTPDLEFVIPVLNEESNIEKLARQIADIFLNSRIRITLIFVDDGSTDGTWKEIKRVKRVLRSATRMEAQKLSLRGIRLIRNLGQMRAIEVGLSSSVAPYVVVMDGDLQHPARVALELWNLRGEADTIAAKQIGRKEKMFKRLVSSIFYRAINLMSGEKFPPNVSDFRIISRHAIRVILASKQPVKVIRFLTLRLNLTQKYIDYSPESRSDGTESRYSLKRMINLGFQSLAVSSTRLLMLGLWLCLAYGIFFLVVACYAGYFLFTESFSPGWISIIGTVLISFSLNFLVLGITCVFVYQLIIAQDAPSQEYISEIY